MTIQPELALAWTVFSVWLAVVQFLNLCKDNCKAVVKFCVVSIRLVYSEQESPPCSKRWGHEKPLCGEIYL